MISFPVEVVNIGFSNTESIENAIQFLSEYQDTFDFVNLKRDRFETYHPPQNNQFTTDEIYNLVDKVFVELGGIHIFSIGIVEKRLDGKKLGNLISSMQENKNGRFTGQAIATSYYIAEILKPIPIDLYYMIELLSFSIRFVVGSGMVHEREQDRYCLFHKKQDRRDIREIIKEGYISRESHKQLNKYLNLEQRISFRNILENITEIANSADPYKSLKSHLDRISLSNLARLRQTLIDYFNKSELQGLCFDLGIDFEDLPGEVKTDKARELVKYMKRQERIPELVEKVKELRPKL